MQVAEKLTDVGALCKHFNSMPAGSTLDLKQNSMIMWPQATHESTAGLRVPSKIVPAAQPVTKASIDEGLFQLQSGPPGSSICYLSGSKTTLAGINIKLLSGDQLQCLVLECCDGVCLRDMSVSGEFLAIKNAVFLMAMTPLSFRVQSTC
jgi:hypothetical protein